MLSGLRKRLGRMFDTRPAGELDIADLVARSIEFRGRFEALQRELNPAHFGWYPYNTLSNFAHFDKLLTGERRRLLRLAGGDPVLDLGCGDGTMGFFLESLGMRVHALDHPASNYNRMQGVRTLKQALDSPMEILTADLDTDFALPEPPYGLGFLLGTLYHLKNPFHVLETLALRVRYLVFSTRIARYTPGRRTDIDEEPVAYLLDDGEANSDWTNFWIFSSRGLRRLAHRAGWRVLDFCVVGSEESAEPASPGADARAFCLAESRLVGVENNVRLLEGWHDLEYRTWRWTARAFSVLLDAPAGVSELEFFFSIPEAVFERLGPLTLAARTDDVALARRTFGASGPHHYVAPLPAQASGALRIHFELDKCLCDPAVDSRELGVQVCFAAAETGDGRLSDSPFCVR